MMIFSVSCSSRQGKGLGFRSRYLAGLVAGALRRRFVELDGLPESTRRNPCPTWTAAGPSERFALQTLGLNPRDPIPLPLVIQGAGNRGVVHIGVRGDAMTALGNDVERIERAIVASVQPAAIALGLHSVEASAMRPEHLAGNDRAYYHAPAVTVRVGQGESVEDALARTILQSAASTAYGYPDRVDRLLEISGIGEGLRIEEIEHAHPLSSPRAVDWAGEAEPVAVSGIRFSLSGKLYGPLMLVDRPGRERPCVAMLDTPTMARMPEAA